MTPAPRLARLTFSALAAGALLAPALVLAPASAGPAPHGSCADVQVANPGAPDGEYQITSYGRTLSVWCADMATTPVEYLTLQQTGPGVNISQTTSNSGRTETAYTRLRLNLPTSASDPFSFRPDDARFGTTSGVSSSPVRYASAGGCNWAPSTFNIDLRGTPFALDRSTIVYVGWMPGGDLVSSPDDKVHTVTNGRGDCGGMLVDAPYALLWTDAVSVFPVVSTSPADVAVTSGDDAVFTATSSGGAGTSTVWQTSPDGTTWTDVPGASSGTLTLSDVTRSMDGLAVRAVFTNVEGTDTTDVATLSVAALAAGVGDPAPATVTSGDDATFSVTVTGDPAPTLQWQTSADGTTWTDVAGATGTALTLPAVTTSEDGLLVRVVGTNEGGTDTSGTALLTVEASLPTVTDPQDATVTAGDDVSFSVTVTGDPLPTVRWEVSSDDGATWDDTGFTGTELDLPGAPSAADGLRFRAVAINAAGEVPSAAALLTVEALAPQVLTAPAPVTVDEGQDATFTVEVSGDPEPTIQWQTSRDGATWTDLDGETGTSTTFTGTSAEQDGLLVRAVVENPGGVVRTDAVVLGVKAAAIPVPVVPGAPVLTPEAPIAPAVAARAVPSLARTGTDAVDLALLAGLLVAGGAVVTAGSRRRAASR